MLRGMYTSASGMLVERLKTDVVANNLANVQTHGFKRQGASVRSFPEMLLHRINDPGGMPPVDRKPPIGRLGTGAALDELSLDMTQGALAWTGRPLDVAVEGPGFLAVETPDGGIAYTRNGSLHLSFDGYLVTSGGLHVLGVGGPLLLGAGIAWESLAIDEAGGIWNGGERAGQLALFEFAEPRALERLGDNLLAAAPGSGDPVPAGSSAVRQGYLEKANVNVVREMVDLISIQRAYEANQKMLQVQDETLGRLINDTGAVA